ncbi:zinc-ribbon domain-containing protein [Brevifollis gellanilyticus]|nr:zinc-ribbon domain-containing protein [Brevifollis gellanilyticus]
MIIWGSKAKQKEIGSGQFYCPQCRQQSAYAHLRVSQYFTLYFIPLFPMETLGEGVCCRSCASEFNISVLSFTPEQIETAMQPWLCGKCGNRNPQPEIACLGCRTPRSLAATAAPPPLPAVPHALPDDDSRYQPR